MLADNRALLAVMADLGIGDRIQIGKKDGGLFSQVWSSQGLLASWNDFVYENTS